MLGPLANPFRPSAGTAPVSQADMVAAAGATQANPSPSTSGGTGNGQVAMWFTVLVFAASLFLFHAIGELE